MEVRHGPIGFVSLQVGECAIAGGDGEDFGTDGAGAVDIAFGIANDEDVLRFNAGEMLLGPLPCIAGYVVSVRMFAAKGAHFECGP